MHFLKYLGMDTKFTGEFHMISLCFFFLESRGVWSGMYHKTFRVASEDGGHIALLRTYDHTTTLW